MPYKDKEKQRKYGKKWRKENPEKVKRWQEKNKGKRAKQKRKWKLNNIEKVREYGRKQIKKDYRRNPIFYCMSSHICKALKGNKAGRKWETLVGYTLQDLIKHLESRFDDKMNWNNYSSYWVIDHIKPKSLFNFTKAEDPEFKLCWCLENLQPLEKNENRRKWNYY